MTRLLKKSDCAVVVLEPNSTIRQLMLEILRDFGFENVLALSSTKDLVHQMEVERVDWIITPHLANQEFHTLQILNLILSTFELRHIRVSLLVDEADDKELLAAAFAVGLLSYHPRDYIRESLISEIEDLISILTLQKGDELKVSAQYLRSFMGNNKFYKDRLVFERNLLELTPGEPRILVSLAETLFLNTKIEEASVTLEQAKLLDPKLAPHCKRIYSKYAPDDSNYTSDGKSINALGIKNCIVIDPDTDMLHFFSECLEKVGVKKIETFESGIDAWTYLSEAAEPALIICEWRVPDLPTPVLIQRIRQKGFVSVPILVGSSLLSESDAPLAKEIGVDALLKKPFPEHEFLEKIVWLLQENRKPSDQDSLERKVLRLLHLNKLEEASRLIALFKKDERFSEDGLGRLMAFFEYTRGDLDAAESIGLQSIALNKKQVALLNLLGKICLEQKRHADALIYFEAAAKLAPGHIDRLLDLANCQVEVGKQAEARQSLNEAHDLDPDNPHNVSEKAQLAIASGDSQMAASMLNEVDSVRNIVASMNNRAVAYSKSGRYEECVNLYKETLATLPIQEKLLRDLVSYNLALGHARFSYLDESLEAIKDCATWEENIKKKALSLKRKIEECKRTNTQLSLSASGIILPEEESKVGKPLVQVDLSKSIKSLAKEFSDFRPKKGDVCCYDIYLPTQISIDAFASISNDRIRFRERDTVVKTKGKAS